MISAPDLEQLVRPDIRRLVPYRSARSEYQGTDAVFLDANEHPEDLFADGLHRYPDPLQNALKEAVARYKGVPPDRIFLGNGSDEAIDLLFRIFCRPGLDAAICCPPTYGMYRVQADIHGASVLEVGLDGRFQPRPDPVFAATTEHTRLLFLCSPNNPTGNDLDPGLVERLLRDFPGIVVVDEAYIDFSESPSWSLRLAEFPNLVVLQTFSKAWGLAGARVGMAFANPWLIHHLNRVKYPYNVSSTAQAAVFRRLARSADCLESVRRTVAERAFLATELSRLPAVRNVFPSQANFLLVRFHDCLSVFRFLLAHQVVVRDRSREPGCADCLRITVGTATENRRLLQLVSQWRPGTDSAAFTR
ncbi:MAG: hypothetical protein RLY31_777 [Bacteroidota bacterium]|jgi:histidinol-phosphate aminotransferase